MNTREKVLFNVGWYGAGLAFCAASAWSFQLLLHAFGKDIPFLPLWSTSVVVAFWTGKLSK